MSPQVHHIAARISASHAIQLNTYTDDHRLLLLDDQPLVVESIRGVFARVNDQTKIVGFSTTDELRREHIGPDDLVLISFGMSGMSGIDDLTAFRRCFPEARFGVIAAQHDHTLAGATMRLGGIGFVSKTLALNAIYYAIRMMLEGVRFVPDCLAESFAHHKVATSPEENANDSHSLTPRQIEVLALLSRGMSNKEIGNKLGITEVTVKVHLRRAYRILGVCNRISAVRKLLQDRQIDVVAAL